jgi:hypothetical protein
VDAKEEMLIWNDPRLDMCPPDIFNVRGNQSITFAPEKLTHKANIFAG